MRLLHRIWRWLLDFITSEPGSGQRRERLPLDARSAMLREVDALRRIATLSRNHADSISRQFVAAEQRSLTLDGTARSLVAQGSDGEARDAIRLKLENDRLLASLRELHARAEQAAQQDLALSAHRETEVRERLEQLRQLAELEALNAQRLELEKRKLHLTGGTNEGSLEVEEARIHAEAQRLRALVDSPGPVDLAARTVSRAADEALIDETIAAMKCEEQSGNAPASAPKRKEGLTA